MRIRTICLVAMCAAVCACGRVNFEIAMSDAAADARSGDAAVALPAVCPADARLLACFSFDGDVSDRSLHGNDGTPVDIMYTPGLDDYAVVTHATSRIDLLSPTLAASRLAIDAWLRPSEITSNQIVFDHDAHWALTVDGDVLRCASSATATTADAITRAVTGAWVHVACTFDGTTMTIWVGGAAEASVPTTLIAGTGAAAIAGNAPSNQTAFPYLGAIDRLRIWSEVLTPDEICTAAGC